MLSIIIIDSTGNEPEQIGNFLADTATLSQSGLRLYIADKETRIAALGVLAEWEISFERPDVEKNSPTIVIDPADTDFEFAISAR